MAGDVYAVAQYTGRGGWSWYTGAAGWMYRFIVESLLGLRVEADQLRFAPCVPVDWNSFQVRYRYRETDYDIAALRMLVVDDTQSVVVDGVMRFDLVIPLIDDRQQHIVEMRILASTG